MSPLISLILAGVLSATPEMSIAEREAEHQLRLDGLDLGRRAIPANAQETSLSSAAGEDFRVSLSHTPARFNQGQGRVLSLANRSWWVVWEDDRYGSRKILRQRFDSLCQPQGSNEVMAGSNLGADYTDPRLALDTLGRIYFAWRDQTGGMIFVSRYTVDGAPDWAPLLVNDTSLSSFAGLFDMAVFRDGQVRIPVQHQGMAARNKLIGADQTHRLVIALQVYFLS